MGVEDEGEEHDAVPAAQVGQVSDPQLVRAGGAEVTVDEVGAPARRSIRSGGLPRLAAPLGALDAMRAHQALHAAPRHLFTGAPKRLPHPPIAVGVVVGCVQLADDAKQPLASTTRSDR